MCYHAEFGRSAFKGVYRRTKNGERWNSALLGVADPKTETPPTCYHVKFGSSATKSIRINRKEPQRGE